MRSNIFHIFFAFLLSMCMVLVSCLGAKSTNTRIDMTAITRYVQLTDTISLKVFHYLPSFDCDSILSASECIGTTIPSGDTLRVYTICNTDTSIKLGMTVRIAPRNISTQPENMIIPKKFIFQNRQYNYDSIYQKVLTTTYGSIVKGK